MAYYELIKDFRRIRPYMRSFYVYGFRHRLEYDAKSARSYDNERRRVASWLGEYMKFGQDAAGKRVFLSVDSRSIARNPLYRAFRAKSFTDLDITLHFYLMDILDPEDGKTVNEIMDGLEGYLEDFADAELPDVSSLQKKLREYADLGLVRREKEGKQVRYFLARTDTDLDSWRIPAAFFSEAAPLGVVGSYLLDRVEDPPDWFRLKHHYILYALDSEVLCELFLAMGAHQKVSLRQGRRCQEVLPLKIYISTQTGRQYVLGQAAAGFRFFRLDLIDSVELGERAENSKQLEEYLAGFQKHVWGVATKGSRKPKHLEMVIHGEEPFVVQRLQREKRCGTVAQLEDGNWRFEADVSDAVEMLPWIRTFTGRIVSLRCTDPEVEKRFYEDLAAMKKLYGGPADAVQ